MALCPVLEQLGDPALRTSEDDEHRATPTRISDRPRQPSVHPSSDPVAMQHGRPGARTRPIIRCADAPPNIRPHLFEQHTSSCLWPLLSSLSPLLPSPSPSPSPLPPPVSDVSWRESTSTAPGLSDPPLGCLFGSHPPRTDTNTAPVGQDDGTPSHLSRRPGPPLVPAACAQHLMCRPGVALGPQPKCLGIANPRCSSSSAPALHSLASDVSRAQARYAKKTPSPSQEIPRHDQDEPRMGQDSAKGGQASTSPPSS